MTELQMGGIRPCVAPGQTLRVVAQTLRATAGIPAEAAEALLAEAVGRHPAPCLRCGEPRIYILGLGRRRCARCRYTFRPFTGRWLGRHHVPAAHWLVSLRCFELGLSQREAASVSGLSVPTVHQLFDTIRLSLASLDPEWLPLVRERLAMGRGKPAVFALRREEEVLRVAPLDATGLSSLRNDPPRLVHLGAFLYTESRWGWEAFICHAAVQRVWMMKPGPCQSPTDKPFLAFLRSRLPGYYGVSPQAFPFYLKEMEIRYNHAAQGRPLFATLLDSVARHIPSKAPVSHSDRS